MNTMTRIIHLIFATALLVFVGCAQQQNEAGGQAVADNVETTSINVATIQCSMCVANITEALEKAEGVQSVKVDLEAKTATVEFLPVKINLSGLEQTIANAGYDANNTKRNMEAYEKLDECCKIDGGH